MIPAEKVRKCHLSEGGLMSVTGLMSDHINVRKVENTEHPKLVEEI